LETACEVLLLVVDESKPEPTRSWALVPTKLLVLLMVPATPAVPLPHVTAPALANPLLDQVGVLTK
jgi:hypothetical protein